MVFEELKVLEPVEKKEVPEGIRALGAHLHTVEKFTANGEHNKFKGWLISHGSEQDSSLYLDRSSLTAKVHAIMTRLVVVACNKGYTLDNIDIKGAFIKRIRQCTSSV